MKTFILEFNTVGRTESFVVKAKDENEARKLGEIRAKKMLSFLNKVSEGY